MRALNPLTRPGRRTRTRWTRPGLPGDSAPRQSAASYPTVLHGPGSCASASATTHLGSSLRGLFTWRPAGCIPSTFSGAGPSGTSSPASQALERLGREQYRHPVMQRSHGVVRLGGENGEGLDDLARPALGERAAKHRALGDTPPLPERGKRHEPPSRRAMSQGGRTPPSHRHSWNPSAGTRPLRLANAARAAGFAALVSARALMSP